MGDYKEIVGMYDRCPPVGLGPASQSNLEKYVVFPRLYVLFDEANASTLPSFSLTYAHQQKYEMQNAKEIIGEIAHCAVAVGELFGGP